MGLDIIENEVEEIEDVQQVGEGELAVGLKVPTSIQVPTSYLDSLRKYKDIYNDIYKQIEVANKLYKYNAIIGNAVDILIDFAVTGCTPMPTGNKKLDKILKYFFKNVNSINTNTLAGVYPIMQELGLEWFTSGNAFPYCKWENVEIDGSFYKLPSTINLLNPLSIHIPSGPIAFGQEVVYLKYDDKLLEKLRSDGRRDPEAALIKQAVPRSVIQSIKNSSGNPDGIRLNQKFVTHLKRRAKGYQAWGVPYLTRAFSAASLLERIRELDEAISSGLINLVTIFKVGTEEHPASGARLRKFAQLIQNPTATKTLVWAHDVEILQVGPDGKVLAFKDKYRDAKEDLMIALGLPPVLMSLNQQGDEWVSILSLVERLMHWRKTCSLWLEKILSQIAKYNDFDEEITVKWERMNLTDEKAVKNLILAFYDRGLISIKTSLQESGYDFEHEKKSKKEESEDQKTVFTPPNLPFSGGKEVEKGRPNDTNNPNKKVSDKTKTENTVNLKSQNKKLKPGQEK